jgi:oligopeptide transport system permease protein
MTETTLSPNAFEPVTAARQVHEISRPSLSYSQDAWLRLKRNSRALLSLYIIVALLLFTVLGPLLWRVDPASQDVDQISQPPWASRTATVVEPYRSWDGTIAAPSDTASSERAPSHIAPPDTTMPMSLQLAEPANTQTVRLIWTPVTRANGYRIYRNIFEPGPLRALGLPLGEVYGADRVSFEDRLNLVPVRYYYSVVPFDAEGVEIPDGARLKVDVKRVITADIAIERGLAERTATLHPGDAVRLALHPFGTDYLGRDLLARLIHGARVSLFIGIVAPFFYVLIGILYGSAAGFVGGATDQVLMRIADFVIALPFLLFMILFKIAFGIGPGESGILPLLVALILLSWPGTARLVRGQILQIREEAYISASRLLGAPTHYLILRHMIPNTLGVILVTLTFAVPGAIFTEAFLSFIGMGVAPPTPSWGSMCNDGIRTMLTHPHELIFPAAFISITVLAFNLLGDGLRDALDARMRSRE